VTSRSLILIMILTIFAPLATTPNTHAADAVAFTPTKNHHVAELNSNQFYVAGYHVSAPDLYTRERVDATAVTVSFPSTNARFFPPEGWLGAGMFVQGQDSKLGFVDYGYYTMLVIDSSGDLFVDVGLRQTRESTAPLQMPTEELIYAYTWQISGIEPATPITLLAAWDSSGYLHYTSSAVGTNRTLMSIDVARLPNCGSAISKFYTGSAVAGSAFPLGHFVYYFQFGVVSNKIISDTHWSAQLTEPRMLRKSGWSLVETAWAVQGDISYLDQDWMWGGVAYGGVYAEYHQNSLGNPYEVIFSYTGQTLPPGTILWDTGKTDDFRMTPPAVLKQPLSLDSTIAISLEVVSLSAVTAGALYSSKPRKHRQQVRKIIDASR